MAMMCSNNEKFTRFLYPKNVKYFPGTRPKSRSLDSRSYSFSEYLSKWKKYKIFRIIYNNYKLFTIYFVILLVSKRTPTHLNG